MGLYEDELNDMVQNIEADAREERRKEWLLARGVDEEKDMKKFQKHVIIFSTLLFVIVSGIFVFTVVF
jgi:hypothetical protein